MTSRPRPARRLPARVYWFRRVLVLAVALGLAVGVAQLLSLGSDGKGAREQATVVGAEQASTPSEPVSTREARRERRADKKRTPTKTPLPEPEGPCEVSDVVVTPEVKGVAYAGSPVRFRLRLTTHESPACTYAVSAETLAVKLVSGSDRIWSTQDCPAAVPELEVVARKEKAAVVTLGWRGQRSDSTCSRQTPWAQPGWYHVQAAALGAEPTDVQFELRAPVPETITPRPKPERKPGDKKAAGDQDQT